MSTKHKQTRIEWGGQVADVDEGLAPLILLLWQLGIETLLSCEENRPGVAWIDFLSAADAQDFLNVVAAYPSKAEIRRAGCFPETLYNRIGGPTNPWESEGAWEYSAYPMNFNTGDEVEVDGELIETCSGPADFLFNVSVRFPRTDMPAIMKRLRKELRRRRAAGDQG